MDGPSGHHLNVFARLERPVNHPDVGNNPAIGVIDGIKDHCPCWCIRVAGWCRHSLDDQVHKLGNASARFAGNPQAVIGVPANEVRELFSVLLGLCGRKINLVQHRDDFKVVLQRKVEVGQRLSLNALSGIYQ